MKGRILNKRNRKLKNTLIIIIICSILGCSAKDGRKNTEGLNTTQSIEIVGSLVFQLDEETTFEANGPVESDDHFVFYNSPNKSFKFYNKATLKLEKTLALASEGPNSIASPMGFTFDDSGELNVYDFGNKEIVVVDSFGLVKTSSKVDLDFLSRSTVFPTNISPLNFVSGFFYMSAQGNHMRNGMINHSDHTIVRLDAKNESLETFLNYPENYENFIRGGRQSIVALTTNPNTGSLIIGFPLEDDLFELTKEGGIIRHEIKPTAFDGFNGHFFSSLNSLSKSNYKEVNEKYLVNYSYWSVYYDKFSNTYYRFVNVPLTDYEMSLDSPMEKEFRNYLVQVFNSEFRLIAQSDILEGIDLIMAPSARIFSTENGIHVFAKSQLNEDEMKFITLKLSDDEDY